MNYIRMKIGARISRLRLIITLMQIIQTIQDGKVEVVCEVEYNIENESPKDVGVCLYAVDYEDQVDYFVFKEREEK